MASTNEDVVVLATAPFGADQLLITRHLPDRGRSRSAGGSGRRAARSSPGPQYSSLRLKRSSSAPLRVYARSWLAPDGMQPARARASPSPVFTDGAHVAAVRSGNGVMLVRHPEGGSLILASPAALGLLIGLFPIVLQQLGTLGFGLIQQKDPSFPGSCRRSRLSV